MPLFTPRGAINNSPAKGVTEPAYGCNSQSHTFRPTQGSNYYRSTQGHDFKRRSGGASMNFRNSFRQRDGQPGNTRHEAFTSGKKRPVSSDHKKGSKRGRY
ncbi:unnamed protein product [Leptosia nina]|uniref:Uncharacterized protein n=1 Tax=Leptosia nina TaxID=320188 RepID=A0AAV1J6W0_9NEOP